MRERSTIEPRFFETYHYADVITSAVEEHFEHLSLWSDFSCDGAVIDLVAPYEPESAFHRFAAFVIDKLLYDYTNDFELAQEQKALRFLGEVPRLGGEQLSLLPVERAMKARHFDFETFGEWLQSRSKGFLDADTDDIFEYCQELRLFGPYEDLVATSTHEAFFTLFGNRITLLRFNLIVASYVSRLTAEEVGEELFSEVAHLFERTGVLRRASMPEWVRRAVFFRDRGRCVGCLCDLSGIVSLWSEENYDHMVPLASGGLNDVTNIQLLCATCNRRKADGAAFTSGAYEDWYPIREPAPASRPGLTARSKRPDARKENGDE